VKEGVGPVRTYRRVVVIYRREAHFLLILAAIVFVPLGVIDVLADRAQSIDVSQLGDVAAVGLGTFLALQAVTALLGEVFYSAAVASLVAKTPPGERPRPLRIARRLPYGRLVAIDLLFAVGSALSLLLLVAPGVVFFVWFALAAPVAEIEGRRVWDAFSRSRQLVRGHFWTVFLVLVPILLATDALGSLVATGLEDLLGHGFFPAWLADSGTNILLSPFYALPAVVLTVDLAREKASALSAPA
jgi:hypothetical protein